VWLGAVDAQGRAVSFIQSIYWEYGSGVVLPDTGVLMQNRGMSFGLSPDHPQALVPGRRPFHTLNPAMAIFDDGRRMPYGTMGGEGQPQTQAAVFSRYAFYDMPLQQAVSAPRWLLGRTWGETTTSLKLESRLPSALAEALVNAGHDVEVLGPYDSTMGHAGAIVAHPDGYQRGAADPRSDGHVAAV
jgi:gamma-glutamyltranspeptidase/glutathione hydrolase